MTTTTIYFTLYDFEQLPGAITETLGIEPDEVMTKGEPFKAGKREKIAKENMWIIKSKVEIADESADDGVEEAVTGILSKVENSLHRLDESGIRHRSELSIVMDTEYHNPGLHLNVQQIKSLASMGTELDIDIYALPSDD